LISYRGEIQGEVEQADMGYKEVLMGSPPPRVKIQYIEDGVLELRYMYKPDGDKYLGWKMPVHEARDLAQWWKAEGARTEIGHLPICSLRFQSVLISMFTLRTMDVRGVDKHGRVKRLGCSLPREVVEYLVAWLPNMRPY
jgi:hypothetical protein